MKNIAIFLFFIFLVGCNNWKNNVVNTVVEETTSPGLIYKMNYPPGASILSFLSDGTMFLGTKDGKFYKSVDNGVSWSLKGATKDPAAVNSFYYFEEGSGSTLAKYIVAGTKNGIYISFDLGDSWQISLSEISATGEYPDIYCFYKDFDPFLNKNILLAFGGDGVNNKFVTPDHGKSWIKSNIASYVKSKVTALLYQEVKIREYGTLNLHFGTSDSVKPYIIFIQSYLSVYTTVGGYYFEPNNNVNNIIAGYKSIYMAGTNKGIAEGNIQREFWDVKSLLNKSVYSILQTNDGLYFAGTNKGWFYSKNDGVTWQELNTGANKEVVRKQVIFKNKIYFITDNGTVFSTDIPRKIDATVFLPVLSFPEDGSVGVSSSPVLTWYNWRNAPATYSLQISKDISFPDNSTETIDYIYGLSYSAKNLNRGTKYYWRIKAYNLFGLTEWSKPNSFTVE